MLILEPLSHPVNANANAVHCGLTTCLWKDGREDVGMDGLVGRVVRVVVGGEGSAGGWDAAAGEAAEDPCGGGEWRR